MAVSLCCCIHTHTHSTRWTLVGTTLSLLLSLFLTCTHTHTHAASYFVGGCTQRNGKVVGFRQEQSHNLELRERSQKGRGSDGGNGNVCVCVCARTGAHTPVCACWLGLWKCPDLLLPYILLRHGYRLAGTQRAWLICITHTLCRILFCWQTFSHNASLTPSPSGRVCPRLADHVHRPSQ